MKELPLFPNLRDSCINGHRSLAKNLKKNQASVKEYFSFLGGREVGIYQGNAKIYH
jgi:hypothetical protein